MITPCISNYLVSLSGKLIRSSFGLAGIKKVHVWGKSLFGIDGKIADRIGEQLDYSIRHVPVKTVDYLKVDKLTYKIPRMVALFSLPLFDNTVMMCVLMCVQLWMPIR